MPESEYDIYDRQTWKHPRVKWYGEEQHPQIATAENVNPPPYYPKNISAPPQYEAGGVNDEVISLLDLTATTLWMAGIEAPMGMQSRCFLGARPDPPRTYAFSARDRIDETVLRMRSVRDKRYHYIRNYSPGEGFPTLNRYKEKCFMIKPLMRDLMSSGQLTGPPLELMMPMPYELLYNTVDDPHEINNLADSSASGTKYNTPYICSFSPAFR